MSKAKLRRFRISALKLIAGHRFTPPYARAMTILPSTSDSQSQVRTLGIENDMCRLMGDCENDEASNIPTSAFMRTRDSHRVNKFRIIKFCGQFSREQINRA